MNLENIGFYTLEDSRAKNSNGTTPLWRCELILTSACNFACPYCRGIEEPHCGSISWDTATQTVDIWANEGLLNVRFSGGEPTLWKKLPELVEYTKSKGVSRIAISTNGSASLDYYKNLIEKGVNDFSISLDACCAETGDKMAGEKKGAWNKVVENIRELSKLTYVTVGVVLTTDNIDEFYKTVVFAHGLGVSDIRVISSAQWNEKLNIEFPDDILNSHPILKYRINNFRKGRHVRGLTETDNNRCPLALDDMAVLAGNHYPCIIYMREQGKPISKLSENVRKERIEWAETHDTFADPICRGNCLDVCIDYNNKHREFHD